MLKHLYTACLLFGLGTPIAGANESTPEPSTNCKVTVEGFSLQEVAMLGKTSLNVHLNVSQKLINQGLDRVGFKYRLYTRDRYNRLRISDWIEQSAWDYPEMTAIGKYEISLRYLNMSDRTEGRFFVKLTDGSIYTIAPKIEDSYSRLSGDGLLYFYLDNGNIRNLFEEEELPQSYDELDCKF